MYCSQHIILKIITNANQLISLCRGRVQGLLYRSLWNTEYKTSQHNMTNWRNQFHWAGSPGICRQYIIDDSVAVVV